MARGMCTRKTQLKSMIPDSVAARRAVLGTRTPIPPAISAIAAKYVQNKCAGIHGGIRLATYLAYGKCDMPQYARNAPRAKGTKRVAFSKTRSTELPGDPL